MTSEFITGLRARKPDMQKAFVDEYGQRVHAFILDVVGNECDADELTADVFVKAFRAIDSYDATKASVVTWLLRIAPNVAISHVRKPRLTTDTLDHTIETAEPEPEEDPRVELLNRAIDNLNPSERALLHMHYFENAKLSDIAYAVGSTEGAITVRLHRIRAKLKTIIEQEYGK